MTKQWAGFRHAFDHPTPKGGAWSRLAVLKGGERREAVVDRTVGEATEQESRSVLREAYLAALGAAAMAGGGFGSAGEGARDGIDELARRGIPLGRRLSRGVQGLLQDTASGIARRLEIGDFAELARGYHRTFDDLDLALDKNSGRRVVICYAHKDPGWWLHELKVHLKPRVRARSYRIWTDEEIGAGARWRGRIQRELDAADVAVLQVSAEFLASDFIMDEEFPRLIRAKEEGSVHFVWILWSACAWEMTDLCRIQAANPEEKPLDKLTKPDRSEALEKICVEVQRALLDGPPGVH